MWYTKVVYMRPFDFGRGVVYRRWSTGDIRCMHRWTCLLLWWLATACTSTWMRLDLDSGWGACCGRAVFKGSLSRMNGAFVCKVQAQGCVLCCVFYQLQTSLGLHLQPRRCRVGHRPNATGEHISGTACNGVRGSVVMGDYRGSGPVERGSSSGPVELTA